MGVNMAGQVAQHGAETSAARGRNNAKLKNYHRQVKEQDVQANLDNVQYLSDVQEQEADQDATYQAMMDQWSDTDAQLNQLFAQQDFAIEDAIIAMHEGSYAGEQTGATAGRLAGKSAMKAGRAKARAIHTKMMATDEANRQKTKSYRGAQYDSRKLFMDVAFAPVHGFRPAKPEMEAGPSKAGLILGLAGSAVEGFSGMKKNTAPKVYKSKLTGNTYGGKSGYGGGWDSSKVWGG